MSGKKLRQFISECRRVLKVTRKPTREELALLIKVTGAGISLLGLIGFTLTMLSLIIQRIV